MILNWPNFPKIFQQRDIIRAFWGSGSQLVNGVSLKQHLIYNSFQKPSPLFSTFNKNLEAFSQTEIFDNYLVSYVSEA